MNFSGSYLKYAKQMRLFNFAFHSKYFSQNILKYLKQSSFVWKQKKPNVNPIPEQSKHYCLK